MRLSRAAGREGGLRLPAGCQAEEGWCQARAAESAGASGRAIDGRQRRARERQRVCVCFARALACRSLALPSLSLLSLPRVSAHAGSPSSAGPARRRQRPAPTSPSQPAAHGQAALAPTAPNVLPPPASPRQPQHHGQPDSPRDHRQLAPERRWRPSSAPATSTAASAVRHRPLLVAVGPRPARDASRLALDLAHALAPQLWQPLALRPVLCVSPARQRRQRRWRPAPAVGGRPRQAGVLRVPAWRAPPPPAVVR